MTQLAPIPNKPDHTQQIVAAIDRAALAATTKSQYKKAILNAQAAGVNLLDPDSLANYAATLPKSSRSFLKAAVSRWAAYMTQVVKGAATPETVDQVTAAVYRLEALQGAIEVKASKGTKGHTWLSQAQVRRLVSLPDTSTISGRRDKIALGLLAAAGLRRDEAVRLRFDDIALLPIGDQFRTVLNVTGKGARARSVPVSNALAADIEAWAAETGGTGRVLRSVNKSGKLGASLSAISLFKIVNSYGKELGIDTLAPHDLRRTYAQLGYEAGIPITQISKLLGHASVKTTQGYLNLDLDLTATISDFIPY